MVWTRSHHLPRSYNEHTLRTWAGMVTVRAVVGAGGGEAGAVAAGALQLVVEGEWMEGDLPGGAGGGGWAGGWGDGTGGVGVVDGGGGVTG